MTRCIGLLALLGVLAGCSGGTSELSKKDDAELRHNFSRPLNPDEIAQMGKAKPAGRPSR